MGRMSRRASTLAVAGSVAFSVAIVFPGLGRASEEWPVSSPESVGINHQALDGLLADLKNDPNHDLKGIVVIRHGKLAEEWYFNGDDRNTLHDIRSAAQSLLETAADPRLLGASIGFLAVLHTWGQRGPRRRNLSRRLALLSHGFRKCFLRRLRRAFRKGALQFHGDLKSLAEPARFQALCDQAAEIDWVVHVKPPFGGPRRVLKYLARYTHRVAISNHRLRALENGRVSFEWKDYAHRSRTKLMTLDAIEFLRRFLLHVLPTGLVRIRHFGFLANRVRKSKLDLCRTLLAAPLPAAPSHSESGEVNENAQRCPICKLGRLLL